MKKILEGIKGSIKWNKETQTMIIGFGIIFVLVNWVIAAIVNYGLMEVMSDYSLVLKSFPISLKPQVLGYSILAIFMIFGFMQTMKLNQKNLSMRGIEHGSADWGTREEIEPYIEQVTYWYKGLPCSKKEYDKYAKDNYKLLKDDWSKLVNRYKTTGKNNPYGNFENYKNKILRIETNPNGTFNNLLLSQTEKISFSGRRNDGKPGKNTNVCLVGGSGTGKTRFYVKPNLMQMCASYIVTDPKGTILNEIGFMLKNNGYQIKVLNLFEMDKSMHYNPFVYLKEDNDCMRLVTTLITNTTDPSKQGGDEFWTKAEELLYQALFGYVWKECKEDERNLSSVVDLLSYMEVREDDESFKNVVDYLFDDVETVYNDRRKNNPDLLEPFYLRAYKNYKLAAGKTAKSILISAAARLRNFNIQSVADLVKDDELEIEELGKKKQALFVIIPDTDTTYNFIAAMMYSQIFNRLCVIADTEYDGRLPVNVVCYLDEFANIGQIPNWDKLIATIRSRGISATMILQTKSQLKTMYKDAMDTIIGNCDVEIFLGGKESSTLKDVSEGLGKKTIDSYTTSKTYSSQDSQGLNYQIMGRELMTVDELKVMDPGKCIVQVRGIHPFFSDKYDITKHPRYMQIYDKQEGGAKKFDVVEDLIIPYRKSKENYKNKKAFYSQQKNKVDMRNKKKLEEAKATGNLIDMGVIHIPEGELRKKENQVNV